MDGDLINLTGDGQPEEVEVKIVTGRAFLPEEDQPGAAHAAVFTVTLMRPHSNKLPHPICCLCSIPFSNRTSEHVKRPGTPGVKQQGSSPGA